MTLTPSECAKLGSQKSREVSADIKYKNIKRYNKNPKLCKKCNGVIIYEKRRNNFCSQSCAAQFNNVGRIHKKRIDPEIQKIKRNEYIKSDKYKNMRCNAQNKRNASKREVLLSKIGDECLICKFKDRITIHRKDGNNHKDFRDMSWDEINDIVTTDKNKYVSVCYKCHKNIHWCMKYLGMTWNEIYQLLNERVSNS